MLNKLFAVLVFFISSFCFAQNEAAVWYFGQNAGIKFQQDGSVIPLGDGKLSTNEGCATISNSNGDLLFYTDGRTVWDKDHVIMPNANYTGGTGLLGDPSSTNSAIIVPKPGSSNIYYIFTLDEPHHENAAVYPNAFSGTYLDEDSGKTPDSDDGLNNGLNYSIVDLNKIGSNGSKGDIISRNNPLITYDINPFGEEIKYKCSEKITAVKDASGNGYWVITQFTDNFYAFRVTSGGVVSIPVKSDALPKVPTFGYRRNAIGCFKASPNGKKLAAAYDQIDSENAPYSNYKGSVYIYDFDNLTGKVNNPNLVLTEVRAYGVEFSSDSNVLYASYDCFETSQSLAQFNLLSSNIANSKFFLFNAPYGIGALQLGPNNKIYYSSYLTNSLGVINNPNVLGLGCDFNPEGQKLADDTGHRKGLPPFISSFFDAFFDAKNLCFSSTTEFILNSAQTITSATWDFGDGTTSTDINPKHTYPNEGTFTINVTAAGLSGTSTKIKDIIISKVPTATKPHDLLICDNNNDGLYSFDLTSQNTAILNGQDPNLYGINYFVNGTPIGLPNSYTNIEAYGEEIITAEVYNKVNVDCKSSTSFNIDVFDTPKPNLAVNIPALTGCDNTTEGTDTDGKILFDLTQREVFVLNGQSSSQFAVSYYKDASFTQLIASPKIYHNTNSTEIIFVKVVNKDNTNCTTFTSFKLEVFPLPVVANAVSLKQCDDDIDGFSYFNLEEAIAKITFNSAVETITFHTSLADAQNNTNAILNQTAYRNQTVSTDKVYVRIANNSNCYRTAQLNLIVSTTQIPTTYSKTLTQCDDGGSGTNKDGIAAFDLSSVTNDITKIFPAGQLLDITYYQNIADALSEKNAIADISNYRNSASPNTEKIFIRVDSRLNNDCLGLGGYITLKVEPVPVVKSIEKVHCDDDQDGLYAFDTSNLEQELLNGLTNVTVSYADHNNSPLPSPLPNPFITNSQIIKVVVTNNTPTLCSFGSTISFIVDDLPEAFPIDLALTTVCDDEPDPAVQDGKYAFDTSIFENILLGTQTGMTVHYYDSNNNPLPSPLPNPFVTGSQNVKAEVVNPNNTNCAAHTLIAFLVNPVPKISLSGEELVCSNLPTFTKQIDAGLLDLSTMNDYNYQWFFNGDLIPDETHYALTVNKEGIFTVEVRDKQTQCARSRTIKVSASDIASNIITVVDELNTISVLVTGNGNYIYALDDQNGFYQNENTFLNVHAGIHTVYIKDQNGCGTVQKEVAVFGVPAYFTPNQDGYNDYWNIEGVNETSNAKTIIQIFDRYGKFLKQIKPLSLGWDGTYLGNNMPSDDYWYMIKLEDNRVIKGHFALKR